MVNNIDELPDPEPLLHLLGSDWPGGRHIVDHVDDGPWQVVGVIHHNHGHPASDAAMYAYPPRPGASFGWENAIQATNLHLMPTFAAELVEWTARTGAMDLAQFPVALVIDEEPTELHWIAALLAGFGYPKPYEGAERLDPTRECYDLLLGYIWGLFNDLHQPTVPNVLDALEAFIAAWHTPES